MAGVVPDAFRRFVLAGGRLAVRLADLKGVPGQRAKPTAGVV
jgi:hypothetical protein